jgi:hypothetical protein
MTAVMTPLERVTVVLVLESARSAPRPAEPPPGSLARAAEAQRRVSAMMQSARWTRWMMKVLMFPVFGVGHQMSIASNG